MKTALPIAALSERIHSALAASPHVPDRQMFFEAQEGCIVLKGQVDSFFQKQMAQEVIRRVDGVEMIDNLIEVSWG